MTSLKTEKQASLKRVSILLCLSAALIMAMGWGVRGAYGHSTGAAMPGALVSLVICLCAHRPDWWRRTAVFGFLGYLGWAFGGQASYGIIVGYTSGTSFPNVYYGYACLFIVGGIWGGIGAGLLSFGVTKPRSYLNMFIGPLTVIYVTWFFLDKVGLLDWLQQKWSIYDTYWVKSASAFIVGSAYWLIDRKSRPACQLIVLITVAWWLGLGLLTGVLGLHMTPPRSDSWAALLGVTVAIFAYLIKSKNWAGLMLACYGVLAGGIGFACGDFIQMLGRAKWGPIAQYPILQKLPYWTLMEQTFGFIMGLGVAIGFIQLIRGQVAPAVEDKDQGYLNEFAVFCLLVPMMWVNFKKNVHAWIRDGRLVPDYLGLSTAWWAVILSIALVGLVTYALYHNRQSKLALIPNSALGKGQLLFLLVVWFIIVGYFTRVIGGTGSVDGINITSFWLAAFIVSFVVLSADQKGILIAGNPVPATDQSWIPGWRHWLLWAFLPIFLAILTQLTVSLELPIDHQRFNFNR